ncbi:AraC-type DNA-binding protein [Lachnospiraceae bacterium NK3A20]|nr:AraC-type DNA-binding protein [Lachnospiraceae bacterium NK3A20]
MLINNLLYNDKHYTIINDIEHETYYYFDYDVRSEEVNMAFQHLHIFYELLILLAPAASHLIDGIPYAIREGDIVCLAPSVMHKSIYYKGDPSKRIVIDFMFPLNRPDTQAAYREILQPFHEKVPIYRFDFEDRNRLYDLLNDIFRFSDSHSYYGTPADEFYIHTKFQEFLYTLYDLSKTPGANRYENDETYTSIEQKIYEISAYIHSHYSEDLTLNSLSEQFYISPSYLSREFKATTHFNLTAYIQETRIKNAQYLLSSSDEKIADVAERCGFTSFSQFNRTFNRISGMSPRAYRQAQLHLSRISSDPE